MSFCVVNGTCYFGISIPFLHLVTCIQNQKYNHKVMIYILSESFLLSDRGNEWIEHRIQFASNDTSVDINTLICEFIVRFPECEILEDILFLPYSNFIEIEEKRFIVQGIVHKFQPYIQHTIVPYTIIHTFFNDQGLSNFIVGFILIHSVKFQIKQRTPILDNRVKLIPLYTTNDTTKIKSDDETRTNLTQTKQISQEEEKDIKNICSDNESNHTYYTEENNQEEYSTGNSEDTYDILRQQKQYMEEYEEYDWTI
jgi:hypothetical protein